METLKEILELIKIKADVILGIVGAAGLFTIFILMVLGTKGCEAPNFSANNTDRCIQGHLSSMKVNRLKATGIDVKDVIEMLAKSQTSIYKEVVKTCKEIHKRK